MNNSNPSTKPVGKRDQRILILAPTGRDAELSARIMAEAWLSPYICASIREICREINKGAGVVFLTEESLPSWHSRPRVRFS